MKNFGVTSVLLLTLVLASPSAGQAQVLQPSELCSDQPASAIATFEDANLEARVRAALSVGAQDDLTCGLVSQLTRLDAEQAEIASLVGLQNLTGLTHLDLWDNAISDVSPLRDLTGLTFLGLGDNSITDLSALTGLTDLTYLNFRENSISDIAALRGLTRLTNLDLTHNSIGDISVLAEFTAMETLRIYNNPISDIGPLEGLTRITELHVHDLPDLSDIRPLLDNTGLGPGDRVILMRSAISCADADALRAKGVSVGTSCLLVLVKQEWEGMLAVLLMLAAGGAVSIVVLKRFMKWKSART